MSQVVDFAAAKREREPHIAGTFICVGCRHEWTGVAPLGKQWLDCPNCSLPKGTAKCPVGADVGDLVLTCTNCGSEVLTAYKRAGKFWVRCMGCGQDLTASFYEG